MTLRNHAVIDRIPAPWRRTLRRQIAILALKAQYSVEALKIRVLPGYRYAPPPEEPSVFREGRSAPVLPPRHALVDERERSMRNLERSCVFPLLPKRPILQAEPHDYGDWRWRGFHDGCKGWRQCRSCGNMQARTSSHHYSEWAYTSAQANCRMQRKCDQCGYVEVQYLDHKWVEATTDPGLCVVNRTCAHCGEHIHQQWVRHDFPDSYWQGNPTCRHIRSCTNCRQQREESHHEYGEWSPVKNGSCVEIARCRHCGAALEERTSHQWTGFVYTSPTSCFGRRACGRCGAEDTRIEQLHEWSQVAYASASSCDGKLMCGRCGAAGAAVTSHHQWGSWSTGPHSCISTRVCAHCGATEHRGLDHSYGGEYRPEDSCDIVRRCTRCGAVQIVRAATDEDHSWTVYETHYDSDGSVKGWSVRCSFCRQDKYTRNEYHPHNRR